MVETAFVYSFGMYHVTSGDCSSSGIQFRNSGLENYEQVWEILFPDQGRRENQ